MLRCREIWLTNPWKTKNTRSTAHLFREHQSFVTLRCFPALKPLYYLSHITSLTIIYEPKYESLTKEKIWPWWRGYLRLIIRWCMQKKKHSVKNTSRSLSSFRHSSGCNPRVSLCTAVTRTPKILLHNTFHSPSQYWALVKHVLKWNTSATGHKTPNDLTSASETTTLATSMKNRPQLRKWRADYKQNTSRKGTLDWRKLH